MPRFTHVHDLTPPDPPDVAELAIFPVAAVPYALAALEHRIPKYVWSQDGYVRGVQLIRSMQMALLTGGMTDLIESNNRIYRLLDSALYGRVYEQVSVDPIEIVPAIPVTPDPVLFPAGMLSMVDQLPGILDAGWFGIGGHKATLADVVAALRVGNSEASHSLWDNLKDILDAGSDIAGIGNTIQSTFFNAVDGVEEGGIMILLAAAIVGNLAATGALSTQLSTVALQLLRISNSIDGGGLPPGDSILEALRGDVEADDGRNVIGALGDVGDKLDELIAELENEHDDNTAIIAKLEAIRTQLV